MSFARIDAFTRRATTWLVGAGAVVLAVMMAMTFFDVIGRYLFNRPIVGTVDLTELYMGLIVYLGIGATTYGRNHIRVDIVTTRLPPGLRRVFDLLAEAISAVVAGLICWQLWVIAAETVTYNALTRVWEVPVYPVAYAIAAASVIMVVALGLQLVQTARALIVGSRP